MKIDFFYDFLMKNAFGRGKNVLTITTTESINTLILNSETQNILGLCFTN